MKINNFLNSKVTVDIKGSLEHCKVYSTGLTSRWIEPVSGVSEEMAYVGDLDG